ncbi:MAG: SAM-dependent methyltransferase [Pirellulaceae bacterium]|nr:MAG: SAM-dependent methyltransferase [Pirellulaceae bacterium]
MRRQTSVTTATRIEALRERIRCDAPGITHEIREAARECLGDEARFRTRFAFTIESWARKLDIPIIVSEERTLITGRADATYNRLIIEYEAPGRLRDNPNHKTTAHAIQQAKDYVEGVAHAERQQVHRLIGVALDGHYFIYVRKVEGRWTDPDIEEVNEHSVARFLRLLVSLVSGKALLPDNLVQDFGSNTIYARRIASSLYRSLSRSLDDDHTDIVDKIFEQWRTFFGEVTGYEEASRALRNRPELRQFARGMGLDVSNVDPPRLFFTVHTYFALLVKLIAYYALSRFVSGFGTRFGSMYQLDDRDLRREMEELERGGIFRTLGIRNFLEGDFFKWYLYTWDANVAQAIRTLLDRLKDYDPGTLEVSPEQARDLLKKLYHRLMPREIRHDLGEYYTPDWLAEHVLNELGYEGQPDKRFLDPACGSGTFLVLAIKRLKERCFREGLNEQETLETILNNIVGIDLNPLAAIAARTNYLLALGDLLVHRTREIDIPVYLADSILTPAVGQELFNHDRYELNTVVGQFDIPSCVRTQEQINTLCNLLEECVSNDVDVEVFLDRARNSLALSTDDWEGGVGCGQWAREILRDLYSKLTELHEQGLDGIWARIIQNAFMPLFLGQFDYIAGNPPWVNWQSLPEQYRDSTAHLWRNYGIFETKGLKTVLGPAKKDVSMLMSYIVTDKLLAMQGKLGFVITQTVFKTAAGNGFRRFRIGSKNAVYLRLERVSDFNDFQPFERATNRTSVFVWTKGQRTRYPVRYTLWQKTVAGHSIDQDASLPEVLDVTRRLEFVARPISSTDNSAPFIAGRVSSLDVLVAVVGPSAYRAHEGINTGGANGVFFVRTIYQRPDRAVIIRNLTEGIRRRVRSSTADIEHTLIYPLLRGRDVQRWKAIPSHEVVLPHSPESGWRPIDETTMQRRCPRTYRYLCQFKDVLLERKSGWYQKAKDRLPFYILFSVGAHTFARHKVVWREQAAEFTVAAVVSEDRPIIPDHKLMMVAVDSAEEAYYLAGMLGNVVSRYVVASYILCISTSTAILENLAIPRYERADRQQREIADCSRRLHEVAAAGQPLDELEDELDHLAARLFGITDVQLAEIRESYRELTKADLREAREADQGNEEPGEAGEAGGGSDAGDTAEAVVLALVGNGEMAASEIATALGIDNTASLRPVLRRLIESGRVERIGRGRGTRYKLVDGS